MFGMRCTSRVARLAASAKSKITAIVWCCAASHGMILSFNCSDYMAIQLYPCTWEEAYALAASCMQETTNGWQTLNATPQELSNGKFQMGPASVKEVQNGTSDCYDTDFVIGEVNGDIKLYASWICFELVVFDTCSQEYGTACNWTVAWKNTSWNTLGKRGQTNICLATQSPGVQCAGSEWEDENPRHGQGRLCSS